MDLTSDRIDLSREGFLDNLVASRLLSDAELKAFVDHHPDADAIDLSDGLLAKGLLTPYQLAAISQGQFKDLRIGNYDIMDKLGAGGMGTVLKARHRRMKRVVALKLLLPMYCQDESFIRRFQREVETLARLGHPNIVMAYDADDSEQGYFLVMEFVDGRDLASLVAKQGPMDVPTAVDCILQAARGLAYAHQLNVVHRDIKPANLLRDQNGVVKVTDLGLARLSAEASESEGTSITKAGYVLGTPDYMSPEQAVDSSTLDHRADIYSLGGTLYFLLIGRPMYTGTSVMAILMKHRDAPIPLIAEQRDDIPPMLDAIFQKMVAKRTSERYQSMQELIEALEGLCQDSAITTSNTTSTTFVFDSSELGTQQASSKPTLQILIAEPSRVQAGIIRKYLEAQGLTAITIVTSGADALEQIRQSRPDAIISTLHLPDMLGVDLARTLQSEGAPQQSGVVIISSESDAEGTAALHDLHKVVALHKPFTPEQLVNALNAVTEQQIAVRVSDSSAAGLPTLATGRKPRSMMRVLIVDDSSTCRIHERMVLQQLGFTQFTEAADGANAIADATRESFDLVVTDYNMPLMNGSALISYLKQNPKTRQVPIVMVTTETNPELIREVQDLGVEAVFGKSFSVDEVRPLMQRLFG